MCGMCGIMYSILCQITLLYIMLLQTLSRVQLFCQTTLHLLIFCQSPCLIEMNEEAVLFDTVQMLSDHNIIISQSQMLCCVANC